MKPWWSLCDPLMSKLQRQSPSCLLTSYGTQADQRPPGPGEGNNVYTLTTRYHTDYVHCSPGGGSGCVTWVV